MRFLGLALLSLLGTINLLGSEPPPGRKLWYASLAAVAVSNQLDIHSSMNHRELNRALAGPNGRFTSQSAAIKLGIQAPALAFQAWYSRRKPSSFSYKAFAIANFVLSGAYTGAAIHNYRVR